MRAWLLLLAALPLAAHVVSNSTGDAQINGPELRYELRMPLYEVPDPDRKSTRLNSSH